MTVTIGGAGNLTNDTTFLLNGVKLPSVSWSSVVSANVTANANYGYAVNTAAGSFSVNLPATANVGDSICIIDYGGSAAVNNITINPNGNKIQGLSSNSYISTNRASFRIVYIDSTRGWMVQNSATVGLGYGVDYLVVAGGGSGGFLNTGSGVPGGGGGAGGYRTGTGFVVSQGTSYTVTVGGGGTAPIVNSVGSDGSNSIFSSIISYGGGGGAAGPSAYTGRNGGSGGGGAYTSPGGTGNTPSVSPSQGNNGAAGDGSSGNGSGGGGGASSAGSLGAGSPFRGGAGGNGTASSITGASVTYAGGGGGASYALPGAPYGLPGTGGAGGTGGGGTGAAGAATNGTAGTANRGGGGGGGGSQNYPSSFSNAGSGGSGIVIISYAATVPLSSGGTITSYTSGPTTYQVHTFTTSGTFTA